MRNVLIIVLEQLVCVLAEIRVEQSERNRNLIVLFRHLLLEHFIFFLCAITSFVPYKIFIAEILSEQNI